VTNAVTAAVGSKPCFSAVGHRQNLRKRMTTDRGSGWGRFVAERGLYCLPTGRRFELAGQLDDILSELVQIRIAARRQSNRHSLCNR